MRTLTKFSSLLLLIAVTAFACFAAPVARHARGPSVDMIQQLFPFAAPIEQPELIDAVYTNVEVVDLGDNAIVAKGQRISAPLHAAYTIEVEYAYIGPRLYDRDPTGTRHDSRARGFAGLGANHFARADV